MRALCIPLMCLCLAASAAAQLAPAGPQRASAPATAPTSPAARVQDGVRTEAEARAEPAALPQVAVPLRRTAPPDPVAVKPGRAAPVQGGIDESAARCRAGANAPDECARAGRPTRP